MRHTRLLTVRSVSLVGFAVLLVGLSLLVQRFHARRSAVWRAIAAQGAISQVADVGLSYRGWRQPPGLVSGDPLGQLMSSPQSSPRSDGSTAILRYRQARAAQGLSVEAQMDARLWDYGYGPPDSITPLGSAIRSPISWASRSRWLLDTGGYAKAVETEYLWAHAEGAAIGHHRAVRAYAPGRCSRSREILIPESQGVIRLAVSDSVGCPVDAVWPATWFQARMLRPRSVAGVEIGTPACRWDMTDWELDVWAMTESDQPDARCGGLVLESSQRRPVRDFRLSDETGRAADSAQTTDSLRTWRVRWSRGGESGGQIWIDLGVPWVAVEPSGWGWRPMPLEDMTAIVQSWGGLVAGTPIGGDRRTVGTRDTTRTEQVLALARERQLGAYAASWLMWDLAPSAWRDRWRADTAQNTPPALQEDAAWRLSWSVDRVGDIDAVGLSRRCRASIAAPPSGLLVADVMQRGVSSPTLGEPSYTVWGAVARCMALARASSLSSTPVLVLASYVDADGRTRRVLDGALAVRFPEGWRVVSPRTGEPRSWPSHWRLLAQGWWGIARWTEMSWGGPPDQQRVRIDAPPFPTKSSQNRGLEQ